MFYVNYVFVFKCSEKPSEFFKIFIYIYKDVIRKYIPLYLRIKYINDILFNKKYLRLQKKTILGLLKVIDIKKSF